MKCLEQDLEECLTAFKLPLARRVQIRTCQRMWTRAVRKAIFYQCNVDAGDIQADHFCGFHRAGSFRRRDLDQLRCAATMRIVTAFTFRCPAFHCRYHAFADDTTADIGAAGLLDEFLHQAIGAQPEKSLDNAFRGLFWFRLAPRRYPAFLPAA